MDTQDPITTEEIERCIKLLSRLTEDASLVATIEYAKFLTLSEAAGRFSRPHKTEIQKRHKALNIERKKEVEMCGFGSICIIEHVDDIKAG